MSDEPQLKSEPIIGSPKAIDAAIAKGEDPNADLDKIDPDDSATKAQMGLALKLAGASYTDIAKTAGYSSATKARIAVERVLAAAADSPEDREKMRVLTSRRINRLLQSVMGKAVDPKDPQHLAYNARALALIDREARLFGVDAPTQIQITPTDQYIQQYIEKVSPLAAASLAADEADILDAEMVD